MSEPKNRHITVPAWLAALFLAALSVFSAFIGQMDQALTCLVGAMVITAVRQIEHARRKREGWFDE